MAENQKAARQLIASDRVEGTTVYDAEGRAIGNVKRLMIEKATGQVAYVVITFGHFFDLRKESHAIPWSKLSYDTTLHGYRADISEAELKDAPSLITGDDVWFDVAQEEALEAHFRVPPGARAI